MSTPTDSAIVDTFARPHVVRNAFSLSDYTLGRILELHPEIRVGRTPGGDRRISVLDLRRALGLPVPVYFAEGTPAGTTEH